MLYMNPLTFMGNILIMIYFRIIYFPYDFFLSYEFIWIMKFNLPIFEYFKFFFS